MKGEWYGFGMAFAQLWPRRMDARAGRGFSLTNRREWADVTQGSVRASTHPTAGGLQRGAGGH